VLYPAENPKSFNWAMELKDRIREAMEYAEMTRADLARATKRTGAAVTQWLDGDVKSLKAETAALMERATGYSSTWLVTGKGSKLASEVSASPAGLSDWAMDLAVQLDALTTPEFKRRGYMECTRMLEQLKETDQKATASKQTSQKSA